MEESIQDFLLVEDKEMWTFVYSDCFYCLTKRGNQSCRVCNIFFSFLWLDVFVLWVFEIITPLYYTATPSLGGFVTVRKLCFSECTMSSVRKKMSLTC